MYLKTPYLAIDKKPERPRAAYGNTRRLWLVVAERPKTLQCLYLGRYQEPGPWGARLPPWLPPIRTCSGVWVAPGRWAWRRRVHLEVQRCVRKS